MNLTELKEEELLEINGGYDSIWGYIGYGIGYVAKGIANAFEPDYFIPIPITA